jgi:hypothetical protein
VLQLQVVHRQVLAELARRAGARFSVTARRDPTVRAAIAAIPGTGLDAHPLPPRDLG